MIVVASSRCRPSNFARSQRASKIFYGEVFFQNNYSYYDNGCLKSVRVERSARVTLLEWEGCARAPAEQRSAL